MGSVPDAHEHNGANFQVQIMLTFQIVVVGQGFRVQGVSVQVEECMVPGLVPDACEHNGAKFQVQGRRMHWREVQGCTVQGARMQVARCRGHFQRA